MTESHPNAAHFSEDQLIAYALGNRDPDMLKHMEGCESCRNTVAHYQSIVDSTQSVLGNGTAPLAEVVACQGAELVREVSCEILHTLHHLHVSLGYQDGQVIGQLTSLEKECTCWHHGTVRLFGREGFITSTRITDDGTFILPIAEPDEKYSLGLVLADDKFVSLKIIG
ncbi:MAG: hypothetical protein U9R25_04675 [Chloroflexota bacterium]|nr:hypothetical protein [Chloroflexota bacterium]